MDGEDRADEFGADEFGADEFGSGRLYPPAPVMSRGTSEPTVLGGIAIPAGTLITIPIYAPHRHRRLWQDADAFDPSGFAPPNAGRLPRTQFMPFGFGPRTCIGATFAMIEAKVLPATLVRAARFTCDSRLAPEPVSRVTLRPRGGMPLTIDMICDASRGDARRQAA